MTLDEFMKNNDYTDESFGKRIGKSRIQILRYRQGVQIPGRDAMKKIFKISGGHVTADSFYAGREARGKPNQSVRRNKKQLSLQKKRAP